jgi:hypothetical protein
VPSLDEAVVGYGGLIVKTMSWVKFEGNAPNGPLPGGALDSRKLVVLVDADGMRWVGIRFWRPDLSEWWANSQKESAVVTHWMDLPEPPMDA